jgi:hypothetical protein
MKSRLCTALVLLALVALSGSPAGNGDPYPLPEDRGTAGILAAIEKLPVYSRVLHITAHADDESAGTLTWLSRGVKAAVVAGNPAEGPSHGPDYEEFRIVPALSLILDPPFRIAPAAGWRVQPAEAPFALSRKGETFAANFTVEVPAGAPAGNYPVEAVATMDGQEFQRGYRTISYPGNRAGNAALTHCLFVSLRF